MVLGHSDFIGHCGLAIPNSPSSLYSAGRFMAQRKTTPRPSSLSRIMALLDLLNCGAALIDRGGILVHVNARLCQLAQRSCDDLRGTSLLNLYAEPTAPEAVQATLE